MTTLNAVTQDPPLVDCRGMLCPAPILRLAETARKYKNTDCIIAIMATDPDFIVDLEAWCRSTKSAILRLETSPDGLISAEIQLGQSGPTKGGSPQPGPVSTRSSSSPNSTREKRPGQPGRDKTSEPPSSRGRPPPEEVTMPSRSSLGVEYQKPVEIKLETSAYEAPRRVPSVVAVTPMSPANQPGRDVEPQARSLVIPPPSTRPGALADAPTRENRATLLILKNDLESLLAALMVANASAAQGMVVEVFFAFWAVHLLRGQYPRSYGNQEKPGLLQRLLLWLTPKGAKQKLGRLNFGGLGTRIVLKLMRRRNILALPQLMEAAAAQGVRFRVCTMSMGLMGLGQRDIVNLPNVDFAGVTTFSESAAKSATALVF